MVTLAKKGDIHAKRKASQWLRVCISKKKTRLLYPFSLSLPKLEDESMLFTTLQRCSVCKCECSTMNLARIHGGHESDVFPPMSCFDRYIGTGTGNG
jgi:hypothetical protein